MITVMTIAGSDPSTGAGIFADIKTLCALKVNPVCAITCVTSQNNDSFFECTPVAHDMLKNQIDAVLDYYNVNAVKIGMIYSMENLKTISQAISHHGLMNVVLDPLITSSSGKKLVDYDITLLKTELLPHIHVLTPNVAEAEKLTGHSITKADDLKEAALEISSFGCENIVITGFKHETQIIDLLYDGEDFIEIKSNILDMPDLHGTGCTFSSSAAAFLAKEKPLQEAIHEAHEFTYNAIKHAHKLGEEKYALNHFFMQG